MVGHGDPHTIHCLGGGPEYIHFYLLVIISTLIGGVPLLDRTGTQDGIIDLFITWSRQHPQAHIIGFLP